ncbi:MAG: IPT/TIG domain-containing protein [Ignavibacteriales bacterium]|nr:IPT/TIG domain-containing protein [Ignavibacteriales bacterium]
MKAIFMNKIKNVLLPVYLLISTMILFSGCGNDTTTTLFDPNVAVKPDPVISTVTPDSGLSGITELTITGTNFSSVLTENTVYFNQSIGTVLEASPTMIKVRAGVVSAAGATALVKIRVKGALAFSNTVTVKLIQAAEFPFAFQSFELPSALEFDKNGNMYYSLLTSGVTNNIVKVTPAGVKSNFTPSIGGGYVFTSLKMGPDGALYGVRNSLRAIFRMTEGAAIASWFAITPNTVKIADIDFDEAGNIWACGDNASLFRVSPTKVLKSYPFVATASAIRVYNNAVYVAVKKDSAGILYRFPLDVNGDIDPANAQTVANLSASVGFNVYINQFTMDINGNIFLATNNVEPILKVTPAGVVSVHYPGVFLPLNAMYLTWDNSSNLYYTRASGLVSGKTNDQTIVKVLMGVQGAAYSGRK